MTRDQIITIQTARRKLGLDEAAYRMILRNTGKVGSCKDLTNAAFEQVMAVFEEMGFRDNKKGETYWRDKAHGGGTRDALTPAERMRFKVNGLDRDIRRMKNAGGQDLDGYSLPAMVSRLSRHRTHDLHALDNKELWNLIEALKAIQARAERQHDYPTFWSSTPADEGSAAGAVTEGPARTRANVTDDQGAGRGDVVTDDEIPF